MQPRARRIAARTTRLMKEELTRRLFSHAARGLRERIEFRQVRNRKRVDTRFPREVSGAATQAESLATLTRTEELGSLTRHLH